MSRRIHKPPIIVHQSNKFSLLQARQTFRKKSICILVAKNTIKVIWCPRAANFCSILNFGQNEIYRLYRICGLLGEHNSKIASIRGCIADRIRAQPPNGQTDSERRRAGETGSDGKEIMKARLAGTN
jgi:hypothetical protein